MCCSKCEAKTKDTLRKLPGKYFALRAQLARLAYLKGALSLLHFAF